MKQHISETTKSKMEILEEIKKTYRMKPITVVIVLIATAFAIMTIIGAVNNFGRELISDFISALISLFLAWNMGFVLYLGAWEFLDSRRLNKVLFPKLEELINESEKKSYHENEAEAYKMVKEAYADYTDKNNKLHKIFWNSIKLSLVFPFIAIAISFIYHQL
ncbi:hypothetical protein ACQKP0_22750 [Heyndrickxia sp. NPDC080065]|uniref:hypothetical protein n=1 Tax=Heyndrickxia sp. NPDC080065 TaxID=3390568 RepID=UPI003D052182